jgi:hypothetical protein
MRRTQAVHVQEQGAEDDIWAKEKDVTEKKIFMIVLLMTYY